MLFGGGLRVRSTTSFSPYGPGYARVEPVAGPAMRGRGHINTPAIAHK